MPNRHLLTTRLRSYAARITERADADAHAAGLTVEVRAGGVRRYRDPRLDRLAAHRASQALVINPPAAAPDADWPPAPARRRGGAVVTVTRHPHPVCLDCAASLHVDEATGELVDQWGQAECGASCRAHAPDVPVLPVGPAAPATSMPDRLRRTDPLQGPGRYQTRSPTSSRSAQDRSQTAPLRSATPGTILRSRLDMGHPAGPAPDALRAGGEEHAPARPGSGPAQPGSTP
jgi:hypothetical protein